MAQPSVAITRLDLSMSYGEFSLRANRMKFGWTKILPPLVVGNLSQSDYPRINIESLLENVNQSDERAPYGTYPRDNFTWGKDSYSLKEHGVEEVVDDALIEMYGDIISSESLSRDRAIDRVLRRLELDAASSLFTSAWSYKTAISTKWSVKATATPIDDINNAIETVEDRIGVTPNKIAMTDRAWRRLKLCAQLEDKLDSGSNDNPNNVNKSGFLSLFDDLDELIILGGYTNTNGKGLVPALGRVWDNTMVMVFRGSDADLGTNDLTGIDPHLGRTLFHQEERFGGVPGSEDDEQAVIVEEYREEARRGGVIRARNHRQIKLFHEKCGQLLTTVL